MSGTNYKYWSREDFFSFLKKQAHDFDISLELTKKICFSDKWNPPVDFNGCNLVQDSFHPFLPCFIHDFRWIVEGGGIESDREFRTNLIKAGFSKWKAQTWFVGVRIGWILYFKWTK